MTPHTSKLKNTYIIIQGPKKNIIWKKNNTEVSSKLMGHSDVTITSKYYVNVDAERKLDAVEKISKYSLGDRIEDEW